MDKDFKRAHPQADVSPQRLVRDTNDAGDLRGGVRHVQ
jgi:hypothetical protein